MATSLRDIPGANRARKRRRSERGLWAPSRPTKLDLTPSSLRLNRPKQRGSRGPSRQIDLFLVVLVLGALGVAVWLLSAFWSATRIDVEANGIVDGRALTPEAAEQLDIEIALASSDELFRAKLTVDGVPLLEELEPEADGRSVRIRPAELVESELVEQALAEGEHRIELSVGRMFLADSTFTWRYVVDSIAPELSLPAHLDPVPIAEPVAVRGTVEEGAELRFRGEALEVDDGEFAVDFDTPPTGSLQFTAVDEAGNTTTAHVVVPVIYPDSSKAIHVSGAAWANDELKAGVMDLIDRGLVDTVELDLKDEAGVVSYDSTLPQALEMGAVTADYDLAEAVQELEAKGIRVIGRLVAFRDPIYAAAAWADGRQDEVLQTPSGGMLDTYGGFANYANPAVRQYNLDIAVEAVGLGVKDILWDYIRRPEGDPDTMLVPGLVGPSSAAVTEFLSQSHATLRSLGAYQGASVFGIAAAAGDSIAQDVPAMAAVVDYLAPMLYPSHWGPGMYRVDSPINEPGAIISKSLADFQRVTEGTGVRFLPWLQDFTLYGVPYGAEEVRAQIDAAAALGVNGFMLWNPNVRYHADALTPIP
ncbi:MAG: putative glycoside hydrolase [Acidimicrobiales bacterium]